MRIRVLLLLLCTLGLVGLIGSTIVSLDPEDLEAKVQDQFTTYVKEQKEDLNSFENQFAVYSNPFFIPDEGTFSKRVFVNGGLVYWNTNEPIGSYTQIHQNASQYIYSNDQGIRFVQRKVVHSGKNLIEIFSFFPIYFDPPVKNQYLGENYNENIFGDYPVALDPDGKYTLTWEGKDWISYTFVERSNVLSEIVGFFCLILVIVSLTYFIFTFSAIRKWSKKVRVLTFSFLLGFAWVLLYTWAIYFISYWDIFNPVNFTAGPFFHSLGHAVLTLVFLLIWLSLFYRHFFTGKRDSFKVSKNLKVTINVGLILVVLLLSQLSYIGFWTILEHSQIDLDIAESIRFTSLRIFAFIYIILVGLCIMIAYSICIRLLYRVTLGKTRDYVIWIITYIIFGFITGPVGWVAGGGFLLACIVIHAFGYDVQLQLFRFQTFVYLIILITAFSSVGAFGIYKHTEKDDRVAKEKFANRLLIKNDILGELYLHEVIADIEQDRYVRSRLLSRVLSRQNIREKIKRQFLSSYFKKYDIEVYFFDAGGTSLQDDRTLLSYGEWEQKYRRDSLATDYEKIYFVQDPGENVRNKYICFLNIEGYGRKVGNIILELTLKKYIPTSVFPELLLESRYFLSTEEFDYAVYKNGSVLYKQGRFSFENKLSSQDLEADRLYKRGMERDGMHYYGLKTQDGRKIIIISPTYSNEAIVANFSFIFLLLVFAYGVVFINYQLISDNSRINLSTKIQLYLGLSFILPMLIVSIALLNTLNSSYREEIDRNFQKRSYNLAENMVDPTEAFNKNFINIDEYATRVAEAGALAQSDVNVYDVNGKLITSSQLEIFRLELLSRLIDPVAFREIKYNREQNLIAEKSIGTLDFKTSYTALRSYSDGSLIGILAMPYFDSKNHLRRQQVEVFSNLISIFTIIFLISILTGNVIVNNLVRPLKRIGDKLRSTRLEEKNQPIQYEAEDEIGSLVKEYNQMVLKLEESKEALAKSQKESAWKEIARQVAHEIKNPLTPMRLKIQQMMRNFETSDKNYSNCLTLIDQIDTLSSIADSFSEFAKMPAPDNEEIDICKLIDSVVGLYQSKNVIFIKEMDRNCGSVFVDPKVFNGILTNIILNAIQATESDKKAHITVKVQEEGNKVVVSIQDEGHGIQEEAKEKIFTPYFSTKSQGSGIGLAVAKKGIENAGGSIWFESIPGKGTTFFISLPLYSE